MKRLGVGLRVILAFAFISAGVAKLSDLGGFAETLRRFEMFPGESPLWIAQYVSCFEIVAGIGLLTPWFCRGAGWLLLIFMLGATAALAQAYFRGLDVDCGCWGSWLEMSLGTALPRNVALTAAIVFILRLGATRRETALDTERDQL